MTAHSLCLLSWELASCRVGCTGEVCHMDVDILLQSKREFSPWCKPCHRVCPYGQRLGPRLFSVGFCPWLLFLFQEDETYPLKAKGRDLFSQPSCLAFSTASLTLIYSWVPKSRTSPPNWSQWFFILVLCLYGFWSCSPWAEWWTAAIWVNNYSSLLDTRLEKLE